MLIARVTFPIVVATALITAGCACPMVRTVIPLKEDPPRDLGWMGSERRLPIDECRALCGGGSHVMGCTVHPLKAAAGDLEYFPRDRALVCEERSSCPGGRAPHGVALAPVERAPSQAARYWAGVAQLEAVSVGSFLRLSRELRAHGAPASLALRAERAAFEELTHAARAALLAQRHGAEVPAIADVPLEVRSFQEVALENEIEGCVHERWSAAVLMHQAKAAVGATRALLAPIAREEVMHAELAHDVSRWMFERSRASERRRLAQARAEARAALFAGLEQEASGALRRELGLPSAERTLDLARSTVSLAASCG